MKKPLLKSKKTLIKKKSSGVKLEPHFVRYTAEELARMPVHFDRAKVEATTDEDIDRQIAEDPDVAPLIYTLPDSWRIMPFSVRKKMGLTQTGIADLLKISVGTWRNWEQGRSQPYGPAAALLRVMEKNPKAVIQALKD